MTFQYIYELFLLILQVSGQVQIFLKFYKTTPVPTTIYTSAILRNLEVGIYSRIVTAMTVISDPSETRDPSETKMALQVELGGQCLHFVL